MRLLLCNFHVTSRTGSFTLISEILRNLGGSSVQKLKEFQSTDFLLPLFSQAQIPFFPASLTFHLKKSLTHFSPLSDAIRLQFHLHNPPKHFSACSLTLYLPLVLYYRAQWNLISDSSSGSSCRKTLTIPSASLIPFSLLLTPRSQALSPSSSQSLHWSIYSLSFIPHTAKEHLACPLSATSARMSLIIYLSHLGK